ncbi:hypothetical protein BH11ACT8_BH11ACT8_28190 [soil metagenome]
MVQPVVYLHIGTRKSGTSYLQKTLRESVPELRAQGVDLAFKTRKGQVVRQLRPLQELAAGGDGAKAEASVVAMAEKFAGRPDATHLITLEDLAELPQVAADLMLGALADVELHLVVTARHWGYTIPSEWQQCVKERDTVTYTDFVAAIRDRRPEAGLFLSRQDLPALVRRWRGALPADRVHVIAVPPSTRTEGTLVDLFCDLVGIDPSGLKLPKGTINQSIQLDQAETLRRVNIALGERLPDLDTDYRFGVREWLTRASLMSRASSSIRLPAEFADWCAQEARAQYDGLLALGVDLVGDAADLLPAPGFASTVDSITDAQVAAVAVDALADLADLQWQQLVEHQAAMEDLTAERDELLGRLREAESTPRPTGVARWLGRGKS